LRQWRILKEGVGVCFSGIAMLSCLTKSYVGLLPQVRVVSMPCWELFAEQSASTRSLCCPRLSPSAFAVEAGSSFGWERYTTSSGKFIGIDDFGASAPANILYDKFGITVEKVVEAAKSLL